MPMTSSVLIVCGRLQGLADGFFDDVKSLPLEEGFGGQTTSFMDSEGGERKFKRRKVQILLIQVIHIP